MADPLPGFRSTAKFSSHGGGHGGFLGTLTHVLGQTVKDLESAAVNSPAGFWHLGGGLIHHPAETVKDMGLATLEDFKHPLRHPGYTLLDALGVTTGAGAILDRGLEASRVFAGTSKLAESAGEPVAFGHQVARSLLYGSPVPERVIRTVQKDAKGKETGRLEQTGAYYSRNLTIRSAQQLLDELHEAHPEGVPFLWKSQVRRQGNAAKQLLPIEKGMSRAEAQKFVSLYRKLPAAMHEAVTMVARGVLPHKQEEFYLNRLASGELKGRQIKEANNAIQRTREAAEFLDTRVVRTSQNPEGYVLPMIKEDAPPQLHAFIKDSRLLSKGRENALRTSGDLSEKSWIIRTLGPKNIMEGHGLPENVAQQRGILAQLERLGRSDTAKASHAREVIAKAEGQLKIDDKGLVEGHIHDPELANELFRIPEIVNPVSGAIEGFTRPFRGGRTTPLGTLTHQYTGAVLRHGGGRWNVAETVAESYSEAVRFLTLRNVRAKLLAGAQDTPDGIPEEYRLPIVVDYWKGNLPKGYQYPKSALEESMKTGEAEAAARWYEPIRQLFFEPDTAIQYAKEKLGIDLNRTTQPVPGVKWIDKRQLGGLEKQNPLWSAMENPVVRGALRTVDFVNTVQKSMLLYLKPAYLFPNMLGNVALSLVHQGFMAPVNMGKTLKVMFTGKGLTPETISGIKTTMGGGLTGVLESDRSLAGAATTISNKVSNAYGKIIDDPFRFSAFLHEARTSGYTTSRQLHNLFTDPNLQDKVRDISSRANDALINYERLGPGEQAILRRLVFFYPWVKGSTRYAYQLSINHPVTASVVGQAGQQGENWIDDTLGGLPSYAEGLIPYSTKDKSRPTVGNPLSFSILQEPADMAKNIANLIEHNPNQDLTLAGNLAPVDAGLLALLTAGKMTTVGHKANERPVVSAFNETFGGNPLKLLYENTTGGPPRSNSLYPDNSVIHALLRYGVLGGLSPRTLNKARANYIHYTEKNPR